VENKTDYEACLKNAVNFYNMNFSDFFTCIWIYECRSFEG